MKLIEALEKILPDRKKTSLVKLREYVRAYTYKQHFSYVAGNTIQHYYNIIKEKEHIPNMNTFEPIDINFSDEYIQIAYWTDSLLHNCRGALETLSHIINYVYELGFSENKITFLKVKNKVNEKKFGISNLLKGIHEDMWFQIINQLRNKSYHRVINTFDPSNHIASNTPLRYHIRFNVDPESGNMSHRVSPSNWKNAGFQCHSVRMEVDEFAKFISLRLYEYLEQVDLILIEDSLRASEHNTFRKDSEDINLKISYMDLPSWRVVYSVDEL